MDEEFDIEQEEKKGPRSEEIFDQFIERSKQKAKPSGVGTALTVAGDMLRGFTGKDPVFTQQLMQGAQQDKQSDLEALKTQYSQVKKQEMADQKARLSDPTSVESEAIRSRILPRMNAIAEQVGVDKELVNMYFGTMSGQEIQEAAKNPQNLLFDIAKLNKEKQDKASQEKKEVFKNTSDLRKEFSKESQVFKDQANSLGRIMASAKDPSPAGDLALIFNFMKVLDPGSTVREGEFANAQNSGSVPQRIQAQYNSIIRGERLTPQQRADFVSRAQGIFGDARQKHQERVKFYTSAAEQFGLDPKFIIQDFEAATKPQKQEGDKPKAAPSDEDLENMSDDELEAYIGRK